MCMKWTVITVNLHAELWVTWLQGPDGDNGSDGTPGTPGLPGADVSWSDMKNKISQLRDGQL